MKTLADHLGVAPLRSEPENPDMFSPNMTDRDFCLGILCSRDYRASLQRRIMIDELPAAVEAMIWDRAFGKVKQTVAVEERVSDADSLSVEAVERRLKFLHGLLQQLRMNEAESSDQEDATRRSVH